MAHNDVEALLLKEKIVRRRPGECPYPITDYSKDLLNYDNWDHLYFKRCFRGLTMHQFENPPETVLDLGCGSGLWVLEAAEQWPDSTIIGMDIKDIQLKLEKLEPYKDSAPRIKWIHGNFLDGLPFPSNHFDFVRIARIGLGVPEDEWHYVLEEILRVMKAGAVLEILEEDLIFPHCEAARKRPSPPPLDIHSISNDSISTRSSLTASSPWGRSQDELDGTLQKKTSLSPLQESPKSALLGSISHFGPRSAHSHRSNSSFIPTPTPAPPLTNSFQTHPQNHSRLKTAWDAMLSRRFLGPQLTKVLPLPLSSWFVDIKTHPTLYIVLPPNSSSDAKMYCTTSPSNAFDPVQQFDFGRTNGRRSESGENSQRPSLFRKKISSWATMHLARTVQTVSGCKEAIWAEYSHLYGSDLPPTTTQARIKEGPRVLVSTKSAARESFDRAWSNWESDMTDRIGMRDNITIEFRWPEPSGERPEWRVWRNNPEVKPGEDTEPPPDICRTIRGFIAFKPK